MLNFLYIIFQNFIIPFSSPFLVFFSSFILYEKYVSNYVY